MGLGVLYRECRGVLFSVSTYDSFGAHNQTVVNWKYKGKLLGGDLQIQ